MAFPGPDYFLPFLPIHVVSSWMIALFNQINDFKTIEINKDIGCMVTSKRMFRFRAMKQKQLLQHKTILEIFKIAE